MTGTAALADSAAVPYKRSFPPVFGRDARLLILGSLPGDRSLAEQRYYAHPQNQFWRLMSQVVGHDLAPLAYEARLGALKSAGVALWDVVASARRPGSTDAAITDAQANDLGALIAALTHLRAIAFNGATAHRHGLKALGPLASRYAILPLPSSSPLHTVGLAAKQPAWDRLRDWL